jgi:hypothetical protein
MKKLFAVAVAGMLAAGACGGDSDTTPRAFETPITDEVGLRPLLDATRDLADRLTTLTLGDSVDKVLDGSSNLVETVRDMELSKKTSDKAVQLAGRISDDVDSLLGSDLLTSYDETIAAVNEAADAATEGSLWDAALQQSNDLVSDLTRWDPDVYSKVSSHIHRLSTLLERAGTQDQVEQLTTYTQEFLTNLNDLNAKVDQASGLSNNLVGKIQTILDRILP